MSTILVVNAGSSSVKFQVFTLERSDELVRKIKGQMDGIGTRPRLRASGQDASSTVDRGYDKNAVPSVPAALQTAGVWLREELDIHPTAVGHRVVHGGPDFDRPVLIDADVLARLERYYLAGAAPPAPQPCAYPLHSRAFSRSATGCLL